jgi:putative tryptophan/tyrosine transport system substrate-binding protein
VLSSRFEAREKLLVKRREFVTLLGGAVAAWPLAARAQQPVMPAVGYMTSVGPNDRPNLLSAFRRGLAEAGYVEGRNITIEYRFADHQHDRLPALAADLVGRKVAVILAAGGGASILAAKAATTTTPVVFTTGGDPVQEGFVGSFNRPGGNLTGVSWFGSLVSAKALGLLHEVLPNAAVIALLVNPKLPESARAVSDGQEAARALGLQLLVLNASTRDEINAAFATLRQRRADALLVVSDPLFTSRLQQVVTLATRDVIPDMYTNREFVDEGGLMSYGNDIADAYRRAAIQVARILKGEKPGELPVDQATKFELVVNLKTAKALGLTIPEAFLSRADEVID